MMRRVRMGKRRAPLFTMLVVACVLMLLTLLTMGEYAALDRRVGRVVAVASSGPGETWVIVGSDSRADLPPGGSTFGTAADVPGRRADVVLVVHKQGRETSVLSLPRDLLVSPNWHTTARLTLTLQQPQMLVDGLCASLGIPTNHLVVIDMAGFARIVDALGGITVSIPHPVTDASTGLNITSAGIQVLTGVQALALVRSRHPRELIDGTWTQATDIEGAEARTRWAGELLHEILAQAKHAALNPIQAQTIAWVGSGVLSTDPTTTLADLLRIWPVDAAVIDVPADEIPGAAIAMSTPDTQDVLSEAGFAPGSCRSGSARNSS